MGFYSSFVVRIWVDKDGRFSKGHVQHVASKEERHFLDWANMLAFVADHIDSHSSGRPKSHDIRGEDKYSRRTQDREARAIEQETLEPWKLVASSCRDLLCRLLSWGV